MSRTRKALEIAAMPVVAAAIYAWLIRNAYLEAKVALKNKWVGR